MEGGGGPDTSGGFKSLVAGQAEKLDDIFKAVYEARDAITNLHAESSARYFIKIRRKKLTTLRGKIELYRISHRISVK